MSYSINLWRWSCKQFWLLLVAVLPVLPTAATAQISPDSTLGAETSRVVSNVEGRRGRVDRIEGGALRGANLFHSFTEFNVRDGQRVYFSNPAGVANILSRVTGSSLSHIQGMLGVDGSANLFLLNPNGVVFGANARLDIAGAFAVSTADRILLADGNLFSAVSPQASLLTVSIPIGLQFGSRSAGIVSNRGNLTVGDALTLSAQTLDLQGQLQAGGSLTLQAQDRLQIRDQAVNPFVAISGRSMLLQGNSIDLVALNHPGSGLRSGGDMVLQSPHTINGDAHYQSSGSFRIERPNGSLGNWGSQLDPVIRSAGDVSFASYRGASLHVLAGGSVIVPGTIVIDGVDPTEAIAETIALSNGDRIAVNGSRQPTLDIRAGIEGGSPAATGSRIAVDKIFILDVDGLVLLTNQYRPNRSLSDGAIEVGTIITDVSSIGILGNSGAVILDARADITASVIGTTTQSTTNRAGDLTLLAGKNVVLNDAILSTVTLGSGDAGDVRIEAGSLALSNSVITTSTLGAGRGGDVTIAARDGVQMTNRSQINTGITTEQINGKQYKGTGTGGDVALTAESLVFQGNSVIATGGLGVAGSLSILARNAVTINNSTLISASIGGNGGAISIATRQLTVQAAGGITSLAVGQGNGGRLSIRATDSVIVRDEGSAVSSAALGAGRGGRVTIDTGTLRLQDLAAIFTSAFASDAFNPNAPEFRILRLLAPEDFANVVALVNAGGNLAQGNSGDLTVRASEGVTIRNRAALSTGATGRASGGQLTLQTPRLSIRQRGSLRTEISGSGNAGAIAVRGANLISIANGTLSAQTDPASSGNGGDILIDTQQLRVDQEGTITASTSGSGNAGRLSVNADQMNIFNGKLSTQTNQTSTGNGGNIQLDAQRLRIQAGGAITASTSGSGDAGNLFVNAEQIDLEGVAASESGLFASTQSNSTGQAGDINITTRQLNVHDNARVAINSQGRGQAGDLNITANSISLDRGRFTAETLSNQGGNINLAISDALQLRNQSQITTSTRRGRGGQLNLNVDRTPTRSVELSGRSQMTAAASRTDGEAGNLNLNAETLNVSDSNVTVSNPNGRAGNLTIAANRVILDNGSLTAQTGDTQGRPGANIQLQDLDLLLMRNGSQIDANAGDRANGGNIAIDSQFIVAVSSEDSNIRANAVLGQGGNVQISTEGLFGIQPATAPILSVSDITASSEQGIQGAVTITQPDVDPSRGLTELPTIPIDAAQQIATACPTNAQEADRFGSFIVSGRGGLPPNPIDLLSEDNILTEWVTPSPQASHMTTELPASTPKEAIVEAQGWVKDANGEIRLVAEDPSASPALNPHCP